MSLTRQVSAFTVHCRDNRHQSRSQRSITCKTLGSQHDVMSLLVDSRDMQVLPVVLCVTSGEIVLDMALRRCSTVRQHMITGKVSRPYYCNDTVTPYSYSPPHHPQNFRMTRSSEWTPSIRPPSVLLLPPSCSTRPFPADSVPLPVLFQRALVLSERPPRHSLHLPRP